MKYKIILTVGAREEIREMDEVERELLATSLRSELLHRDGSPIADSVVQTRRSVPVNYSIRQLTSGHIVCFRRATEDELKLVARDGDVPRHGVVVFDILSGGETLPGGVILPVPD